jgi:hypothetical protein
MGLPSSCRHCGVPGKSLCDACRRRSEARRSPRAARGYDSTYDRNRREIVSHVLENPSAFVCCICLKPFTGCRPHQVTAEHRIPLRAGGTSEMDNLSAAHSWCNYGWRRKRAIKNPRSR